MAFKYFVLLGALALATNVAVIQGLDVGSLLANQNQLTANIQTQQSTVQQLVTSISQQSYRPELFNGFQSSINSAIGLLNEANTSAGAANNILYQIQETGNSDTNALLLAQKLQDLANQQLASAQSNLNSIVNSVNEVNAYTNVYNEAKANQLVQSKTQMDQSLQALLQQTVQSGQEANAVLTRAINDWSSLAQSYAGPRAAECAQKLRVVTEQTLFDFSQLHPEDIEQTTSDAHRTIEDVKHVLYEYGVPPAQVRNAVNNVQSNVFNILNRARALQADALHASIISKRRK